MDNQGYGRYLNGCNNSNSISIEMCVNKDSNQAQTYKNVLELTKNLMKKFNINANNVIRHYDVSRKDCPHNFRANNWSLWWQFKEQIKQPIEYQIDLSKSSTFGIKVNTNTNTTVVTDVENIIEQENKRKEYWSKVEKIKINVNGQIKEVRGKIVEGNNYVAIRDIAELLNLNVDWDNNNKVVILKK